MTYNNSNCLRCLLSLRNSRYVLITMAAGIHELLLPSVRVMRLQLATLLVALPANHLISTAVSYLSQSILWTTLGLLQKNLPQY
jgi:hypothetical protein